MSVERRKIVVTAMAVCARKVMTHALENIYIMSLTNSPSSVFYQTELYIRLSVCAFTP